MPMASRADPGDDHRDRQSPVRQLTCRSSCAATAGAWSRGTRATARSLPVTAAIADSTAPPTPRAWACTPSAMWCRIPRAAPPSVATIGLDDEVGAKGTVLFKVYGDGSSLFTQHPSSVGATPARRSPSMSSGRSQLRLVVADGGDGNNSDHADWALPLACGGGGAATRRRSRDRITGLVIDLARRGDDPVQWIGDRRRRRDARASALDWTLPLPLRDAAAIPTRSRTSPHRGGSIAAPDHDYPSYLELRLTATDSGGATTPVTRRLDPKTVDLTFTSAPSGLQVTVGSTTSHALHPNGDRRLAELDRDADAADAPPDDLHVLELVRRRRAVPRHHGPGDARDVHGDVHRHRPQACRTSATCRS